MQSNNAPGIPFNPKAPHLGEIIEVASKYLVRERVDLFRKVVEDDMFIKNITVTYNRRTFVVTFRAKYISKVDRTQYSEYSRRGLRTASTLKEILEVTLASGTGGML